MCPLLMYGYESREPYHVDISYLDKEEKAYVEVWLKREGQE